MFTVIGRHPYIPDVDLHLDSKTRQGFGFISHAHTDHTARHHKILCTPPTAAFLKTRLKNPRTQILDYGESIELTSTRITLYPAGHILGSAQILIENEKGRLLYIGDFRMLPAQTVESFKQVSCDILIMESTFGQPHYRFPLREEILDNLLQLVTEKLNAGITPVILVYPLGKGQEILYHMSRHNFPLAVDHRIVRLARIYERFGITFGAYEKFKRSEIRSKVLLLPASERFQNFIQNMPNRYLIYLSGWGMDPSARFRLKVDEVLPFSDHADYDELIQFALNSNAREIYCTHGFEQFVSDLRGNGLNARPLIRLSQLDLFDE